MKYIIILVLLLFAVSFQTISSKTQNNSEKQISESSLAIENENKTTTSIREIDFQNFTFPWTKTFGGKGKSFTLKNGIAKLTDERELSFESLSYVDVADDYDEQALVVVKIDDGNATYEMLYVFAVENGKPKFLESFEFGDGFNIHFGTAFAAHGELIIETYQQTAKDAECCPSVIDISYYKWHKDKFVLQGEPQKIPNGFLERVRKKK